MPEFDEVGVVVETGHEERAIMEWRIADFISVAESKDEFNSPIFSFADSSWYLELTPRMLFKKLQSFSLCLLKKEGILEHSVKYNLGTKKCDGTVEQLSKGIFQRNTAWVGSFLVKLPEVQQQKSQQPDMLIITCKLKRETMLPNLSRMLNKTEELISK